MRISMDREYTTRDGREVRIYAVDGCGAWPIHGAIKCIDGSWAARLWGSRGNRPIDTHLNKDDPEDLIKKLETVNVDFWVNVYKDGIHGNLIKETKDECDKAARAGGRVACINIKRTVVEGEGLETISQT
jgi:hypothetical protein